LIHHQVNFDFQPLDCESCHLDIAHDPGLLTCIECHLSHDTVFMDAHLDTFGADCIHCHNGSDSMTGFDHGVDTEFPLTGEHGRLTCSDCHHNDQGEAIPQDCVGCHAEPDQHLGIFTLDCETCHSTKIWSPARLEGSEFQHYHATGFSLNLHREDYGNLPTSCKTCHLNDSWDFTEQTCLTCHAVEDQLGMDQHLMDFGPRCLECHDGMDRMRSFDHRELFPLDGKHATTSCESCHIDQTWVNANSDCVSCHEEPEIHINVFGQKCQYCHIPEEWTPAPLRVHLFPLDHGEALPSECATCHEDVYYTYACFDCHGHDETTITTGHTAAGIPRDEIPFCVNCHISGSIEETADEG
jgi:hypothetical protein